jgi:hypothetical protein
MGDETKDPPSSGGGPPPLRRIDFASSVLLGANKKVVIDAALGTRGHGAQPESLRKLVSKELWDGLSKPERLHLSAIHNTMQQYGLWEHVTKVGVLEKPTADTSVLGAGRFSVSGTPGAFSFETGDSKALYEALVRANFGVDGAVESMMHPGQTSMRESTSGNVTHDMAAPSGLHVSLGPGNKFDAHIDKISPTNPAEAGKTVMDMSRGMLHHRHELHSDLVRGGFDFAAKKGQIDVLGGLDFDVAGAAGAPTLDQPRVPMPEDRNNPTAPVMVDFTIRGPK